MPRDNSRTMTAESLARALDGSRHGRGWRCHCPAHDDAKASLDVTEGDGGIVLVTCWAGCDQADVIDALRSRGLWEGRSGGVNGTAFRHAAEEAVLVDVVPAGAPDLDIEAVLLGCRAVHRRGGTLVVVTPAQDGADVDVEVRRIVRFDVKDPNGRLLYVEARIEYGWQERKGRPDKTHRPITLWRRPDRRLEWRAKGYRKPSPLYGLETLGAPPAPGTVVVVYEGPGKADFGRQRTARVLHLGLMGGTEKVGQTDWSVLKDCIVLTWFDADAPGDKATAQAHRLIAAAGARKIGAITPPAGVPKGWGIDDLVDQEAAGDDVEALIGDALDRAKEPAPQQRQAVQPLNIGSDVEMAGRVVQTLVEHFGEVVSCDGAFWRYAGTHWEAIADDVLSLTVHAYDGAPFRTPKGDLSVVKLNQSRVESIRDCMKPGITQRDFFAEAAVGINCASGFIRFDDQGTPTLEPHSPNHRCRHVLAGRWPVTTTDAQERASLLDQLLDGCFQDDPDQQEKIDLLAEVAGVAALGYATKVIKPKALVLKGETAENGKSQVLDCMRALLPKEAVASISPAQFGDRTFTCHLVGKLLNAPDELAGTDALASEIFKQIITGEPLTVRDVYKSAFDFRPLAQHVYATNNLPTFKGGMDRGVRRRLMVLTFNRVIPEVERIEHIGLRIGREEPDRLLEWAVRGAARVIKNNSFTEPESSKLALADWIFSADPVLGWLESDKVQFTQNGFVPEIDTRDAYEHFRIWATEEGFSEKTLPAINGFVQRVVAAGKGITKQRDKRHRFFKGLACTHGHFG
jgi:P4 family phage/plasmid primase-like protien